jgi:hypothetical protein
MSSLPNAQRSGNAVNGDEKSSRSIFRADPLDRYLPSDAKNRSANIFQVEAFWAVSTTKGKVIEEMRKFANNFCRFFTAINGG